VGECEATSSHFQVNNGGSHSPYINRFLSADSIVPGYVNPQSLNRYSYVNNNPLRYTDPTGHIQVEDEGSTKGCSDPKYCQSGKPKPANELAKMRNKKDKNHNDTGPITNLILQLPGTAEDWNNIATGFDVLSWVTDLYAASAVTYAYFGGAALPAPLVAAGLPEIPLTTGLAGMGLAELYVQPVIFTGNALASIGTGAAIISDTKAGNTRVEERKFSTSILNSMALTDMGWGSNEAFVSLGLQSIAVANDLQWTSLPFPVFP
jgi:RHS repeat-associated protein